MNTPLPLRVTVPVSVGAVVWQYVPGVRVWPPRFWLLLLKLQGDPAATPYAAVKAFLADIASGSLPVCCVPTSVPFGAPVIFVTAVPGLTPRSPVTTVVEGAVLLVTVV